MPLDGRQRRGLLRAATAAAAAAVLLTGCQDLGSARPSPPPARTPTASEERDAAAALLLVDMIQTLQRLTTGAPAEQAEILADAKSAYARTPFGGGQLRYALVLATPGHPAADPVLAQRLLRELAAQPEALMPAERALTSVELVRLDRELAVDAESGRMDEAQRLEHERAVAAQRRLQAELDENAKLRKQLDDAQAKLDEIANIERNLVERKSGKEDRKP
jgi:hypothetical protein